MTVEMHLLLNTKNTNVTLFNTETATLHGAKGRANRWSKMSKKAKKAHSKMMLEAKKKKHDKTSS